MIRYLLLLLISPLAAATRPNVVLIYADDLGYGELGCQGNPQIPTPNIDAIAKNGIRFTSGYVSAPNCSPSRAGLLTGKYQTRFGYENRASTFYDGTEESWSDGANVGKVRGLEFLFEVDYKRQQGDEYLDQHHFVRYVDDKYILKGEYLEDGFADIKYFEASERLTYIHPQVKNLTLNIGAAQRLAEPYGYDPLAEWLLSNGNIHYTNLAIQEGYEVIFDGNGGVEYLDPSGNSVATSTEVWEAVVIPTVLANYAEKKRDQLKSTIQHSLVVGFDYYKYEKRSWLHAWGNLMPYHLDQGGEFSYHEYNDGQWLDYSAGIVYGHWFNKNLGVFGEGRYLSSFGIDAYEIKAGINVTIF